MRLADKNVRAPEVNQSVLMIGWYRALFTLPGVLRELGVEHTPVRSAIGLREKLR